MLFKGDKYNWYIYRNVLKDIHVFNKMCLAGYILSGLPSLSEEYMTVSQQIEKIKNLKLKPDFLINIKVMFYSITC